MKRILMALSALALTSCGISGPEIQAGVSAVKTGAQVSCDALDDPLTVFLVDAVAAGTNNTASIEALRAARRASCAAVQAAPIPVEKPAEG